MAAWRKAALLAVKSDEHFMSTIGTTDAGEAEVQIAEADVLCRANEFLETVITSMLRVGSGGHAPIMLPTSHRSTKSIGRLSNRATRELEQKSVKWCGGQQGPPQNHR